MKPIAHHPDLALCYRGVRVYHTLRALSAGRQNANYSEVWLTWAFGGRDLDEGHPGQFDVRELPAPVGLPLVGEVETHSPLLPAGVVNCLAAFIDGELRKPRGERAWVKAKGGV